MSMMFPNRRDPVIQAGHWFSKSYSRCDHCGVSTAELYTTKPVPVCKEGITHVTTSA